MSQPYVMNYGMLRVKDTVFAREALTHCLWCFQTVFVHIAFPSLNGIGDELKEIIYFLSWNSFSCVKISALSWNASLPKFKDTDELFL